MDRDCKCLVRLCRRKIEGTGERECGGYSIECLKGKKDKESEGKREGEKGKEGCRREKSDKGGKRKGREKSGGCRGKQKKLDSRGTNYLLNLQQRNKSIYNV